MDGHLSGDHRARGGSCSLMLRPGGEGPSSNAHRRQRPRACRAGDVNEGKKTDPLK